MAEKKKWVTNARCCSIPEQITGIRQLYVMHLDVKKFYGSEPSSFGHLRDNPKNDSRKIHLQLFWRFMERVKEECLAKLQVLQKKNKGENMEIDNNNNKQIKPIQWCDEESSIAIQLSPQKNLQKNAGEPSRSEDEENSSSQAEEVSESEAMKEEEQNLPKGGKKRRNNTELQTFGEDEEDLLDPDSRRMCELYIESVANSSYDGTRNKAPEKITGYRFWFLIYHPEINGDKIFADLIDNTIDFNEGLIFGPKKKKLNESYSPAKSPRASTLNIQPWEQWKRIASVQHLAVYCDQYTTLDNASQNADMCKQLPKDSPRNPICASEMWSFNWVITNTCEDTHIRQGQKNFNYYIRTARLGGCKTLMFPLRKLVYKVSLDEISPFVLFNKLLMKQDYAMSDIYTKILPVILQDNKLFSDAEPSPDSESSETDQEQPKIVDEKIRKKLAFKSQVLQTLQTTLKQHNNSIPDLTKTKKFDSETLAHCKWDILDKVFGVTHFREAITSCYGPLYAMSRRNLKMIQSLYAMKDSPNIRSILTDPVRVCRVLYRLNQDDIFSKYISTCRDTTAALSSTAKIMFAYEEKEKLYSNQFEPEEKFDPGMSSFANYEAKFYVMLKKLYRVIGSLNHASIVFKNTFDAYTMHFNRVHQHVLTSSETGAVGKSFLWRLVEKHWKIPGTANVVTYETSKSRATDEPNQCDAIIIYDEVEKRMVSAVDSSDNDKERMFKQLLATNRVSASVLWIDPETGERKTKTTFSACIAVFFGSMNFPFEHLSPAMARRFHLITMNEKPYEDISILEMDARATCLGREVYLQQENRKLHLKQLLIFEIEKLIYVEALTEVTQVVTTLMLLYISNELLSKGFTEPNPTMYERLMTSVRYNVISDALHKLFFNKGCKYEKNFIEVRFLKDLDVLLYSTIEHVVCTLGECHDILIDPIDRSIGQALRKLHNEKDDLGQKFQTAHKFQVFGSQMANKIEVYWVNYMRFPLKGNKNNFVSLICTQLNIMEEAKIKPSPAAVLERLNKLTKRQIKAYSYEYVRDSMGNIQNPKGITITNTEKKYQPIAYWQETCFCIHYEYLFPGLAREYEQRTKAGHPGLEFERFGFNTIEAKRALYADQNNSETKEQLRHWLDIQDKYVKLDEDLTGEAVIGSIIKDMLSKRFQIAGRYVFTNDPKINYLREIIQVPDAKEDAEMLLIPIANSISDLDERILKGISKHVDEFDKKSYWIIDADLDSYGLRERLKSLYITKNPIEPGVLSENIFESLLNIETNEQKDENSQAEATNPLEISRDSILIPTLIEPNPQEMEDQMDKDTTFHNILDEEEEEEEEEDPENLKKYYQNMRSATGRTRMYVNEDSEEDQKGFAFTGEEFNGGIIEGNEDIDYDQNVGYYLGVSLNSLYIDVAKTLDSLDSKKLLSIYKKLDQFDPAKFWTDVDFDHQQFLLSVTSEGKATYHWDVLAQQNGLSVEQWLQLKEETKQDPDIFVYIPEKSEFSDEETINKVLMHNVGVYKLCYTHPWIWNDLENRKYYSDRQEDYGSYPGYIRKQSLNRKERWEESKNLAKNQKNILEKIGKDEIQSFGFKRVVDEKTKEITVKEDPFVFERLVSSISRPQSQQNPLETNTVPDNNRFVEYNDLSQLKKSKKKTSKKNLIPLFTTQRPKTSKYSQNRQSSRSNSESEEFSNEVSTDESSSSSTGEEKDSKKKYKKRANKKTFSFKNLKIGEKKRKKKLALLI